MHLCLATNYRQSHLAAANALAGQERLKPDRRREDRTMNHLAIELRDLFAYTQTACPPRS